jgi:hypothetical protein
MEESNVANINDVYQIRFVAFLQNQLGVITPKYQALTKTGTGATDAQIASGFATSIATSFKAMLNTSASFRGVGAKKIFPAPPGVEASDISFQGVGTGGTNVVPMQCAGLISWYTGVGTRKGRGRSYVPFPAQTDLATDGSFIAAYQTRLSTLTTNLGATITCGLAGNQNTFKICLFNVPTSVATLVTNSVFHTQVATQRRRGFFGRQNTTPF